ncbi:hypothetical protein RAA17_12515 [Komagataeibacter rhaeticus]|nr:hypothetical protein [Komagataeibacter rhaeticus]
MRRMGDTGLHVGTIAAGARYHLKIVWADAVEETADPYSFGLLLDGETLRLFSEGRHAALDHVMGAQPMVVEHTPGVRFAVWAPNARRVSVIGISISGMAGATPCACGMKRGVGAVHSRPWAGRALQIRDHGA